MLKIIGAILMIAAGTLAGFGESLKLATRESSLRALLHFLSAAREEIRYAALPVERLVQKHGTLPFMQVCAQACAGGQEFPLAWRGALGQAKALCLNREDTALALEFGLGLGASDTEGQLAHCALYEKLLEARLQNAHEDKTRKLTLYRSLGVFTGITAALLLC